ncbi:MAG: cyclic nucleotide-binding domain-containing protein [Thalassobaculaceae bacterium]|nr:cyclic nucleotide-binding domain-containing protein [Thalassobaculaceae bacterium]
MRKAMILDRRVYRPGQTLFHEGDQAWAAFMIEKGSVAIVRNSSDGHEVLLATVGEGELIGEMGLIDDEPRSATARATSLTVVQVITQQTFSRLLAHADPGIVALLKVLLRRLRATNEALSTRSDHLTELFTRAAAEEDRPPAT